MEKDYRDALDNGEHVAKSLVREPNKVYCLWTGLLTWATKVDSDAETSVPLKTCRNWQEAD